MTDAAQQDRLMAALGPGDIALEHEPHLPNSAIMTHPIMRGRLLCGRMSFIRLNTAFGSIQTLLRAVFDPKRFER